MIVGHPGPLWNRFSGIECEYDWDVLLEDATLEKADHQVVALLATEWRNDTRTTFLQTLDEIIDQTPLAVSDNR